MNVPDYLMLKRDAEKRVATLVLNRPDRKNGMHWAFWEEFPEVVKALDADPDIRVVVVRGEGDGFSAGLDIMDLFQHKGDVLQGATAEQREQLRHMIKQMQRSMTEIAHSDKVWLAAVHGYCIGGGLDLIAACDLRLASQDAFVSLREIQLAITADLGSLQRLPPIVGDGVTRRWAFTGENVSAEEAYRVGLFSEVLPNPEALAQRTQELAEQLAAHSGITLRGVKHILNYGLSHGPDDGLAYVATWNAAFLGSKDLAEAMAARMEKRPPKFTS